MSRVGVMFGARTMAGQLPSLHHRVGEQQGEESLSRRAAMLAARTRTSQPPLLFHLVQRQQPKAGLAAMFGASRQMHDRREPQSAAPSFIGTSRPHKARASGETVYGQSLPGGACEIADEIECDPFTQRLALR